MFCSARLLSFLVFSIPVVFNPGPAAAQVPDPPQPSVALPRVELGASVAFKQRLDVPAGQRDWTGPGLSLTAHGNLNDHLALVGAAETFFDGRTSVLGGARLSSGFFYGNNRDPIPGRYFAKVLVGSVAIDGSRSHAGAEIGGGADVMFHARGVCLHWEVGFKIVPGAPSRQGAGYVEIGVIFGPRLFRSERVSPHRSAPRASRSRAAASRSGTAPSAASSGQA